MTRHSRKYGIGGVAALALTSIAIIASAAIKNGNLESQRRARVTERERGPVVLVTTAKTAPLTEEVTLIGESRPYFEATLYAKVSGYLRNLNVDKGDWAQEGQRLALIESPETDKAYLSALADYTNKHRIAQRYRVLLRKKLVSTQEAEGVFAADKMALAALETQKTLKGYETVIAPFSGRVTARYVDPGALIQQATGSQSGAQALVTVSQVNRLRIFAYVDQKDASNVKRGTPATISRDERPDEKIEAQVTRTAGALDPRTRTLLTEIDVPNEHDEIVVGSYVNVTLTLPAGSAVGIPARALVLEGEKTMVPVVDQQSQVHYRPVKVAGNNGELVRITDGLSEGERVAVSLGSSISDGQKIQPRELEEQHRIAGAHELAGKGAPTSEPSPPSR